MGGHLSDPCIPASGPNNQAFQSLPHEIWVGMCIEISSEAPEGLYSGFSQSHLLSSSLSLGCVGEPLSVLLSHTKPFLKGCLPPPDTSVILTAQASASQTLSSTSSIWVCELLAGLSACWEKAGKMQRGRACRNGCYTAGCEVGSVEKTQKNAARVRPDTDVTPAIWGRLWGRFYN